MLDPKTKAMAISALSSTISENCAMAGAGIVAAFAATDCRLIPMFDYRTDTSDDEYSDGSAAYQTYRWVDVLADANEEYGNEFLYVLREWMGENPGRVVLSAKITRLLYTQDYTFTVLKEFPDGEFRVFGDDYYYGKSNYEVIDVSDEVNELRQAKYRSKCGR